MDFPFLFNTFYQFHFFTNLIIFYVFSILLILPNHALVFISFFNYYKMLHFSKKEIFLSFFFLSFCFSHLSDLIIVTPQFCSSSLYLFFAFFPLSLSLFLLFLFLLFISLKDSVKFMFLALPWKLYM